MRMNRKRLVVVLEAELYIYDISNMQMLKTEKTSPNPNGRPASQTRLLAVANLCSNMRSIRVLREQLSRIPASYQSRTRYLPTALACAAQDGPHCAHERRGAHIRCYKDGSSQCYRGAQLSAVLHRSE